MLPGVFLVSIFPRRSEKSLVKPPQAPVTPLKIALPSNPKISIESFNQSEKSRIFIFSMYYINVNIFLLFILYEMYPKVVAPPVKINLKKVILGPAKKRLFPVPKVLNDFIDTFVNLKAVDGLCRFKLNVLGKCKCK